MRLKSSKKDYQAFLPAALELEKTPPPRSSRVLLWVILTLIGLLLLWSWMGRLNIVTIAQGQVIPDGKTKPVQALVQAKVKSIHVVEGQAVRSGETLMSLDDSDAQAELVRLTQHFQQLRDDEKRQLQLIEWLEQESVIALDQVNDYLLLSEWKVYLQKREEINVMQMRLLMEIKRNRMLVEKYQAILPILNKKEKNLKKLSDENLTSTQEYLDQKQLTIETAHDLKAAKAKLEELHESQKALQQKTLLLKQESIAKTRKEYKATHENRMALQQEIEKQQAILSRYQLRSPINGRVEQLMVVGLGEVVMPAQQLMNIVPDGQLLEIESYIRNQDIGFVGVGQAVSIKVDAYPFTRYGLLDGEIVGLSSDTGLNEAGEPVYKCRIRPASNHLGNEQLKLLPGMTVVAEVITGERRMLDYFLSPVQQHLQESIRER